MADVSLVGVWRKLSSAVGGRSECATFALSFVNVSLEKESQHSQKDPVDHNPIPESCLINHNLSTSLSIFIGCLVY